MSKIKSGSLSESVSEWLSESVTRSPIELFWTAKNSHRTPLDGEEELRILVFKYSWLIQWWWSIAISKSFQVLQLASFPKVLSWPESQLAHPDPMCVTKISSVTSAQISIQKNWPTTNPHKNRIFFLKKISEHGGRPSDSEPPTALCRHHKDQHHHQW